MRAAIILAAGSSRRFGRRDKLRARLAGRSLLDHVIANARASNVCRVILVTRSGARRRGLVHVRLPGSVALSVSLVAAFAALRPIEREALIFLADMPFARAPHLRMPSGTEAVRPRFRGLPGHPVLVRVSAAKARTGQGDHGLGRSMQTKFVAGTAAHLLDIDTPVALRRARRHGSRAWRPRSAMD